MASTKHFEHNSTPIRGRVRFLGNPKEIQWDRDVQLLVLKVELPDVRMHSHPANLSASGLAAYWEKERKRVAALWQSPAGQRALRAQRSYLLLFEDDGSFHADNVPAGTYLLNLTFTKQGPQDWESVPIASLSREVVVPKGDTPFDLGQFTVGAAN